jgi:DNA-binding response OmpR family regulator
MMINPDLRELTALYVEDEVLIAMDGRRFLRDIGIGTVHIAPDIDSARMVLSAAECDVAILDINLPGGAMSVAFAEELVAAGCPVVFATAMQGPERVTGHLGAPIVAKPFDGERLGRAIGAALAQATEARGAERAGLNA